MKVYVINGIKRDSGFFPVCTEEAEKLFVRVVEVEAAYRLPLVAVKEYVAVVDCVLDGYAPDIDFRAEYGLHSVVAVNFVLGGNDFALGFRLCFLG